MRLTKLTSLREHEVFKIERFLLTAGCSFNSIYSSPRWARRMLSRYGIDYSYIIVEDQAGEILALLMLQQGFRGWERFRNLGPIIGKFFAGVSKLFFSYKYWMAPIHLRQGLSPSDRQCCKHLIYKAVFQSSPRIFPSPIEEGDKIFFLGCNFKTWGTSIINLGSGLQSALKGFKRQAARPINHAEKVGVVVREVKCEELISVSSFMNLHAEYNNKVLFDKSIQSLTEDFLSLNGGNYFFAIFVALYQGEIVATMGVYGHGHMVSEWGVFNSPKAKSEKLYPQDLIKKYILQYCIENQIHKFDLAGFNPADSISEKELGIKNFKRKFGGSDFIYTLVSN